MHRELEECPGGAWDTAWALGLPGGTHDLVRPKGWGPRPRSGSGGGKGRHLLQVCAQAWSEEKAGLCEELNGGHVARVWRKGRGEEEKQEGWQQELVTWGPASWMEHSFLSAIPPPGM